MFGMVNFNENFMEVLRNKVLMLQSLQENLAVILRMFFKSKNQTNFNPQKIKPLLDPIFGGFMKPSSSGILRLNSSKLLLVLGKENPQFYREFKTEILEAFNSDEFFKTEEQVLRVWASILGGFIEQTGIDLFSEHIEFINFRSLFGNKQVVGKKRIKAIQRISFVVISSSQENI